MYVSERKRDIDTWELVRRETHQLCVCVCVCSALVKVSETAGEEEVGREPPPPSETEGFH